MTTRHGWFWRTFQHQIGLKSALHGVFALQIMKHANRRNQVCDHSHRCEKCPVWAHFGSAGGRGRRSGGGLVGRQRGHQVQRGADQRRLQRQRDMTHAGEEAVVGAR